MTKEQFEKAKAEFRRTISENNYNYTITISLISVKKCTWYHRSDVTDMCFITNIVKQIANDIRKYQSRYAKRFGYCYKDLDFLAFPETKTKNRSENTHPHYHGLIKIPDFCDEYHYIIKSRINRLINKKENSFSCNLSYKIKRIYNLEEAIDYASKHVFDYDSVGEIIYYSPKK